MIDYFSAVTIRVLMKTHVTLQVALTEADISQNLTISIFLGNKFYSNNV
jgi:hypothetical protein